jgi:hypothetical protein
VTRRSAPTGGGDATAGLAAHNRMGLPFLRAAHLGAQGVYAPQPDGAVCLVDGVHSRAWMVIVVPGPVGEGTSWVSRGSSGRIGLSQRAQIIGGPAG